MSDFLDIILGLFALLTLCVIVTVLVIGAWIGEQNKRNEYKRTGRKRWYL